MLCTCSRSEIQLEEVPGSPESLATRDYSFSGITSKTEESGSKFDDSLVDDAESSLKDSVSLNYEEARALLGRLEYQRSNYEMALQVFQGIDISGLRARMVKAIVERSRPRRPQSKGEIVQVNVMSMHSVSLLLEAMLLKSKSLAELGRTKDAAMECRIILEIVESAWPNGMSKGVQDECKLEEMFHEALELLPKLWKKAGFLGEAISAYRRALIRPWNLDPNKCASIQKDLAATLLYSGTEVALPLQLQELWGFVTPKSNLEEAILLLLILLKKLVSQEISWDPDIMNHLMFALSLSGQFQFLASHVEQMLPGLYKRAERWYVLALCYSAACLDDAALNILRNGLGQSERKHKPHLPSFLLGAKLCSKNLLHACEGTNFARSALEFAGNQDMHFTGMASHLLGVCYGLYATSFTSDSDRLRLQSDALRSLQRAASIEKDNPKLMLYLGVENAVQRNLNSALENATKYLDLVAGSSVSGWKLLALSLSAEQNMKMAEGIVDLAIDETCQADQLEFLRLKALLQAAQERPKNAIDTYGTLLAIIQTQKKTETWIPDSEVKRSQNMEMEAWLDLTSIYTKRGSWTDANICLDKAKSIGYFSPKSWHITGKLFEAQSSHNKALAAFSTSLSIDPDYVPSMVSTASLLRTLGGDFAQTARSFLMNALRLDPMNHEARLNLGLIARSEGSLLYAADCFQAAYELGQSSPVQSFR